MHRYVLRDLIRNPRRTMAALAGIVIAVGLFSGISLFVDGSTSRMTEHALAPVAIDMQAEVTNALASPVLVTEVVSAPAGVASGSAVAITLTATNTGPSPVAGATLTEPLPALLTYSAGTTMLDGHPVVDGSAGKPQLIAGVPIGTLAPGAHVTGTYRATLKGPLVNTPGALRSQATVTAPTIPAAVVGGPVAPSIAGLAASLRQVSGVRLVQPFGSVDLPAGAISAGSQLASPAKLLAFDPTYLRDFSTAHLTAGDSRGALINQQVADTLAIGPGSAVSVQVPGRAEAIAVTVSGIVDFGQASPLFTSRSPDTQGEFVAAPNVVVVDTSLFNDVILPAVRADAVAATPVVKTAPVVELQIRLDRAALAGDPAAALTTTAGLRRTIERAAPGDITVIDNLSDTLTAVRTDAILAKVLLIALGLPGILVAGLLARYAGGLMAEAQRRERATLRARGAGVGQLLRGLLWSSVALIIVGTALGVVLGIAVLSAVVPDVGLSHQPGGSLGWAAGLSLVVAAVTTLLALYLPSRRTLLREVADQRRQLSGDAQPVWLRGRLDLVFLGAAALSGLITYLTGGYRPTAAAEGQSVSLSFYTLLAPLFAWIGVTLLVARALLFVARRMSRRPPGDPARRPTFALWSRSSLRRPLAILSATIALTLTVAFGTSVVTFASTYQAEKLADARFVIGADVRVTPSAAQPQPASFGDSIKVAGVQSVTPVSQTSAVVGTDKRTVVAIDPTTFGSVATLDASFFDGTTPAAALSALAADPNAVLMDKEVSRTFNVQTGDTIRLQIPSRLTGKLVPVTLHTVGQFTNFPGFPQGVDFVMPIATFQSVTGAAAPDQFLLSTNGDQSVAAGVTTTLQTGVGRQTPLMIETMATAVNRDQSSLAALSLDGLGRMEAVFTVLMAATAMAVFIAGLLMQRRSEQATLRALGMPLRSIVALLFGEATLTAAVGIVAGTAIGFGVAELLVQILRPLFTLPPTGLTVSVLATTVLCGLIAAVTVVAVLWAGALLRRGHLVELLRDDQ